MLIQNLNVISKDRSTEFAELGSRREQERNFAPKNNQILCELLLKKTEKTEMDKVGSNANGICVTRDREERREASTKE